MQYKNLCHRITGGCNPPDYTLEIMANYESKTDSILWMDGGLIQQIIEFAITKSPYFNWELTGGGALSLVSYLAGRNYETVNDVRPNIFVVALAPSGAGKEAPRTVASEILFHLGMNDGTETELASKEGLEDSLFASNNGTLLLMIDEASGLFSSFGADAKNPVKRQLAEYLLKLFSSYTIKQRPLSRRLKHVDADARPKTIYKPCVTTFMTGVEHIFFGGLSSSLIADGTMNRTLFFIAPPKLKEFNPSFEPGNPPANLLATARRICNPNRPEVVATAVDYNPKRLPLSSEAIANLARIQREYNRLQFEADPGEQGIFGRGGEYVEKIALLFAVSREADTVEAVDLARAEFIVYAGVCSLFHASRESMSESDFERKYQKLKAILLKYGPIEWSPLLQKSRRVGDASTVRKIFQNMLESGEAILLDVDRKERDCDPAKVVKRYDIIRQAGRQANVQTSSS